MCIGSESQNGIATAEKRFEGRPATTNSNSSQFDLIIPVLMGTDCC